MRRLLAAIVVFWALSLDLLGEVTAIRAGRLVDPETGRAASQQVILVEEGKITAVGPALAIPPGAAVIDLSDLTVLPGLVDTHTHLGITYKDVPEHNYYYLTYVMESTPLRAIQAASNGIQLLNSGFTVVRDLGNNALYADTAHRQAIEQGWIPGPTLINSGLIIGGKGGQFWPTPEMVKYHDIVYPEYLDADTRDEIVKAVRENMLFGARIIKICVDCKPWGYSVDEMKLFMSEAAKGGLKVAGHVQTPEGASRAIEAGIWSIEHGFALTDEHYKLMAQKGIFLASTDTPFTPYAGKKEEMEKTAAQLKSAWQHGVKITFSTDMDYWERGQHAHARRAHDQLPADLEGRRDPQRRHPQGDDDHRLPVRRRSRSSAGRSRRDWPPTSSPCGAILSRTSTRCATCASS